MAPPFDGRSLFAPGAGGAPEQRLRNDAEQTATLFATVGQSLQAVLSTGSAVAVATDGRAAAFQRSISASLRNAPIITNATLLDVAGDRVTALTTAGSEPVLLDECTAVCERAILRVSGSGDMDIVVKGTRDGMRTLGLAGVAAAGSRYAVYSEISVPTSLYASSDDATGMVFAFHIGRETPESLVVSTTQDLPIRQGRLVDRIQLAGRELPVVFGSNEAAGFAATSGPWILLAAGSIVSVLLALLVEGMRRRRNVALGLVDELLAKNNELDASETALRHRAQHDPLTDLPDRTLFRDRISQEIGRGRRAGESAAVMMVDLDRFKEVNDTLGHQSGDALLLAIAGTG